MKLKGLGFQIAVLASCKNCPRWGKGVSDCLDGYDTDMNYRQGRKPKLCPRRREAERYIKRLEQSGQLVMIRDDLIEIRRSLECAESHILEALKNLKTLQRRK